MNIYIISQTVNDNVNDNDAYDSAVVAAESEDGARSIHPDGRDNWDGVCNIEYGTWCNKNDVDVKLIGTIQGYDGPRVICASFNAG
jgi:hypothetical protein